MGQVQGRGEVHLLMEEKEGGDAMPSPPEDDVLREQSFKRAKGLNLDSFL